MANYKIELKKSAAKEIEELDKTTIRRIVEAIGQLAENPRPNGCVKLSGDEKYRIRVGEWRILYRVDDDVVTVFVVRVGHRREVYKK